MSLAIDPWADGPLEQEPTEPPPLTPDELAAISDTLDEAKYDDHAVFPECFVEAFKVLGDLGLSGDPQTRRTATQCLRRMAYRATTGGWPGEREAEPADSLDSERRVPR